MCPNHQYPASPESITTFSHANADVVVLKDRAKCLDHFMESAPSWRLSSKDFILASIKSSCKRCTEHWDALNPLFCTSVKQAFERWLDKDQEQQVSRTTGCLKAHTGNQSYPDGKAPAESTHIRSDACHLLQRKPEMKKTGRQDSIPYVHLLLASIPTPSSISAGRGEHSSALHPSSSTHLAARRVCYQNTHPLRKRCSSTEGAPTSGNPAGRGHIWMQHNPASHIIKRTLKKLIMFRKSLVIYSMLVKVLPAQLQAGLSCMSLLQSYSHTHGAS